MKKILVIGQTPPPFGGQALMIKRLLEGTYANARLFHVRMAFSKEMDDMGRLQMRKLLHPFLIILRVAFLRLRYKIEVLYYPPSGPDYLPMLRDMAILLCVRWMFKKSIFHFHAAGISELYEALPKHMKLLYRLSYFKPDLAIQLSNFNPNDAGFLQAKTIRLVPNGIEDAYQAMGCLSKPENAICNILSVGMVCESKGILVLLEAIRIIKERELFVKVNVVGKFASNSFKQVVLGKIANYGLEDYFDFKGVLIGHEKHEQYLNADIFCFPTFFESESFGLVAVEAMQFCVPVILTKWRGVQSLIDEGEEGFLVAVKDSQAVAEKIMQMMTDPSLREKMGTKGRERYLREYSIERFYERMDLCFKDV
jgi:glycosyltransferase involved in cell wall biosynthesis